MNNLEKFRAFLAFHNPKGELKTFNFKAIEQKLDIPLKTLEFFARGKRGLGSNEEKVINHFRNLGFEQHIEVGGLAINKGEKITIQDTQSGELAEFEPDKFETAVRRFFVDSF
ncbi:MAG: hypothetical protein NXI00_16125 [Cytophagales bacterium]|nr:hypothetical protein [Cytophagales bacterium]